MNLWVNEFNLALLLFSIPALPQAPMQPPGSATGSPTLEITMSFIQEKLANMGSVSFKEYVSDHSNLIGTVRSGENLNFDISNVNANPAKCELSYHAEWRMKNRTVTDHDFWFSFRGHPEIAIMPYEIHQNQVNAKRKMPDVVVTATDPHITVLVLGPPQAKHLMIPLIDQTLAVRIGTALNHAVDLCGGSKQEPF